MPEIEKSSPKRANIDTLKSFQAADSGGVDQLAPLFKLVDPADVIQTHSELAARKIPHFPSPPTPLILGINQSTSLSSPTCLYDSFVDPNPRIAFGY